MKPDAELISIHRAAKRLGFSDEKVRRMAVAGELPGVQLGGRWYVRNLTAFLDAVQTKPSAPPPSSAGRPPGALSREEEMARLGLTPETHPFL